jgi:hypothetical protein
MFAMGIWLNLLEDQKRKPLLGSGASEPIGFGPFLAGERLLLGSAADGVAAMPLVAGRASLFSLPETPWTRASRKHVPR